MSATSKSTPQAEEPMIDPELASMSQPTPTNGASGDNALRDPAAPMGIHDSIASAPAPRLTDFVPNWDEAEGIDVEALQVDEDAPGSPTAKIMRAIAPPNAVQPDTKWPAPPPNASVNLYIGRALLSNGNDNWPLKPNDIVNWIRRHYPAEWDGDEGRCSAHRVRTYLARKGTDMYYEKLNQGCIAGWRIRQNHLWRFENGGFQGRGMKQEEAIAAAQRESEAQATAAHKAAAAEALAAGHPSVKTGLSSAGVSDGTPLAKRQKTRMAAAGAIRRKSSRPDGLDFSGMGADHSQAYYSAPAQYGMDHHQHQQQQHQQQHHSHPHPHQHQQQHHQHHQPHSAQPSTAVSSDHAPSSLLEPHVNQQQGASALDGAGPQQPGPDEVDLSIVHQALAAAATSHEHGGGGVDNSHAVGSHAAGVGGSGGMDEMDMGIQLPIEMQMHEAHEDGREHEPGYYGSSAEGYGPAPWYAHGQTGYQ